MRIPSEEGPNAFSSESKEMVAACELGLESKR